MAVAEELHFGRAAEKLHTAQPPISRAVAQLEKSLGTILFTRSTRRVELTATGSQLYESARKIMEAVEDAKALVQSAIDGETGHVDIVFAGASTHALVGTLSRELKKTHPGITAAFHSQSYAQGALDQLRSGEADIALGRWDFVPADIEAEAVLEERLVLAIPENHRLSGARGVSFQELAGEPFIELMEHRSLLHDRLLRLSHQAAFEPNVVQQAPDTWTALALVGAEIGVSLTLDSVQRNVEDSHVRFLPVTDPYPELQLRMAWLSKASNPALTRVLETARGIWKEMRSEYPEG